MKLDNFDKAALFTCVVLIAFAAVLLLLPGCGTQERQIRTISQPKTVLQVVPAEEVSNCVHDTVIYSADGVAFGHMPCCTHEGLHDLHKAAGDWLADWIPTRQAGFRLYQALAADEEYQSAMAQVTEHLPLLAQQAANVIHWEYYNTIYWRNVDKGRHYNIDQHIAAWETYTDSAYEYADNSCSAKIKGLDHARLKADWSDANIALNRSSQNLSNIVKELQQFRDDEGEFPLGRRNRRLDHYEQYPEQSCWRFSYEILDMVTQPLKDDVVGEGYEAFIEEKHSLEFAASRLPSKWGMPVTYSSDRRKFETAIADGTQPASWLPGQLDEQGYYDECHHASIGKSIRRPCENHMSKFFQDPYQIDFRCNTWRQERSLPWPDRSNR